MTEPPSFDDHHGTAIESPAAGSGQSLQPAVVAALAHTKGVDPMDLDVQLHRAIDADALDMLAAHEGGTWRLDFELEGHEFTVDSDRTVMVDGTVFSGSLDS